MNCLIQLQSSTQTTAATSSVDKSAVAISENNGTSSNVAGNAVDPESSKFTESKAQPSADIEMEELAANETSNVDEDTDQVTNGTTAMVIEEAVASNSSNEALDDDNATAANLEESVSTINSEADETIAADDD